MESTHKLRKIFQRGDTSKPACGRRMRIIRKLTPDTIAERAEKMGTTTNNLQSMETGASWPSPRFQGWILDNTPIDANFIVAGEYRTLSYEVVEKLTEAAREVPYNK